MPHPLSGSTTCPNCNYQWPSGPRNFCPKCGQANTDLRIPVGHWIYEFVEGILHVDGKAWITIRYLLFQPGRATREFIEGKRVKFIHPVRFYLFVSFVFFLLLRGESPDPPSPTAGSMDDPWREITVNVLGDNQLTFDPMPFTRGELHAAYRKGQGSVDSLFDIHSVGSDGSFSRGLLVQAAKIEVEGADAFQQKMQKSFTIYAFLLMPFYAVLLKLFFRRNRLFYTEHLVLSIHTHTLLFLLMSAAFILSSFAPEWISYLMVVWLAVLHFLHLKNFYGSGWLRSVAAYLGLTALYLLSLVIVLVAGFVVTLFLI